MKKQGISYYLQVLRNSALFWSLAFCLILVFLYSSKKNSSYSFFIEFENANGIDQGTPIRIRGIQVGFIQIIRIKPDCVVALARINSSKIVIPKESIIEINQTGLLNAAVIDIIPQVSLRFFDKPLTSPLVNSCQSSKIICNKMYITGDRGLNYDDLVRSTTRISQRFDDPRFFNLFYVFLQNGIEVTDVIVELITEILGITSTGYLYLQKFWSKGIF